MQKTVTYDAKDSYLRKWFKYGLKAQKLLGASALSIIFALGKIKR